MGKRHGPSWQCGTLSCLAIALILLLAACGKQELTNEATAPGAAPAADYIETGDVQEIRNAVLFAS